MKRFVTDSFFAYGTLQIPSVMRAVTGHDFPCRRAVLEGFARFLLRGQIYPGIIEASGRATDGMLYESIDPRSLALLDEFEGSLYERRRVRVLWSDGGSCEAFAYVVPPARRHLLSAEPWDREHFIARHLRRWVASHPPLPHRHTSV